MTARTETPLRGAAVLHPSLWPWWVQVLVVYLAARLVSAIILLAVATGQAENLWTPASPSYTQYTGLMWDASWYRQIAEQGYPQVLPHSSDGLVTQNAWAFFPLFPTIARLVMAVTGAPWHVAASTLALLMGTVAALVVHQVVEASLDRSGAPWWGAHPRVRRWLPLATVTVLATSAAAPVLQVAYTESLALLLVATTLLFLVRRQYGSAIPTVMALGLTRAIALPIAVAVGAHALSRWSAARRGVEGFPVLDRVKVLLLGVASVVAGVLWPVLVGIATGEIDAYTQTQSAWRGARNVTPVLAWVDVSRWLAHDQWWLLLGGVLGLGVVAVVVPTMRRLGPELAGWTGGYFGYLVLAIEPWTSLLRFLLMAFPLAALFASLALRVRYWYVGLAVLVGLGIAGQVGWVVWLWRLKPPSGWPP